MAINYNITVYTQPSLYDPQPRTLDIFFSEPDAGINKNTGILLLSAGYGGEARSRVFCKMREQFADRYNYVTVQCNYFGWEFMQDIVVEDSWLSSYSLDNNTKEDTPILIDISMNETKTNMNDMGPVQAMDQLVAIKVVSDILKDNGYSINSHRITAYGFSHGAYINYLSNAFMPGVFTSIIDNSSYLFPTYIQYGRTLAQSLDSGQMIKQVYVYLLHHIIDDYEIYKLPLLYSYCQNQAKIISFHGVHDHMTKPEDKQRFLDSIAGSSYEILSDKDIDYGIFGSAKHGLDADFLKLFDYVVEKYPLDQERTGMIFADTTITTEEYCYYITKRDDVPYMWRKKR